MSSKLKNLLVLSVLCCSAIGASAGVPTYNGTGVTGQTYVPSDGTSASGTFSVRAAPGAGHERSTLVLWDTKYDLIVLIHDSVRGRTFYCYLDPGDAMYKSALKGVRGFGNGGRVYAYKSTSSSRCTRLTFSKSSYDLW